MSDASSPAHEPENSEHRELSKLEPQSQDQSDDNDQEAGYGPQVSSTLEIQAKLEYLAGCVIMGVTTPQKANAVRSIYSTILAHQGDTTPVTAGQLADQDVLKVLRENPEMLAIIKPMLTKAQIDLVVREASHD